MKILLATPLYPPDVAEPAPYVKELARRLAETDEVSVVTYGHLPEAVGNVRICTVSKRRPLPLRLIAYTLALWRAATTADILYVQNGPSVELPVALVSFVSSTPLFVRIGDEAAHVHAQTHPVLSAIEKLALRRARDIVTDSPNVRPEILPFRERPVKELEAYERSWNEHVALLHTLFHA